jgi:hypothetical protein
MHYYRRSFFGDFELLEYKLIRREHQNRQSMMCSGRPFVRETTKRCHSGRGSRAESRNPIMQS